MTPLPPTTPPPAGTQTPRTDKLRGKYIGGLFFNCPIEDGGCLVLASDCEQLERELAAMRKLWNEKTLEFISAESDVRCLLEMLKRQRLIDELSPAARNLEQREIDQALAPVHARLSSYA